MSLKIGKNIFQRKFSEYSFFSKRFQRGKMIKNKTETIHIDKEEQGEQATCPLTKEVPAGTSP